MRRLRWRLARLFAPVPIIASPGEASGIWILTRSVDGPYSLVTWVKAETFDLTIENDLRPRRFDLSNVETYERPGPIGSFSGTVGR